MCNRYLLMICLIVFSISSVTADEDDSQWATNFGPTGVSGTVKALKEWGSKIVVAGDIAGLRTTSAISNGFILYDSFTDSWVFPDNNTINSGIDYGEEVFAIEVLPNGDLVLGGNFSFTSNGMTFENIAVYKQDGTWSTLSGDTSDFCDGPVHALLKFGDVLYIGGKFFSLGADESGPKEMFAMWDETNGFTAPVDVDPLFFPFGPDDGVFALSLLEQDGNDYIYVGGSFKENPIDTLGNIFRMNVNNQIRENLPGGGTNGPIYALNRAGSNAYEDELYVGGEFTYAGGIAASHCVMFEAEEDAWHTLGDGLNGPVYAIEQQGNSLGVMVFGGDFDSTGTRFVGNLPRWSISTDEWFSSAMLTDEPVYALENIDFYYMAVGGEFEFVKDTINDSSLFFGVFQYYYSNSENQYLYEPLGDGLEIYDNALAQALDVVPDDSGNFYVAGGFEFAGGKLVNNIAKWDGHNWYALGNGFESACQFIAVNGDTVYTSCSETIYMWNGTSWAAISPDLSWANISGIELDTMGNLYVIGARLDTIGFSGDHGIIMWDGSQWVEVGGPMTVSTGVPSVNDIYIDSTTNYVYICGRFVTVDGVPAANVAMWDGTNWHGLGNAKTGDGLPHVIERSPQGHIIITGFLDRPEFVYMREDSAWLAYAGGISVPDISDLLTVGCHLYISGDPLQYVNTEDDPVRVGNIGVWDGLAWDSLGSGVNFGAFAMAAYGDQLAICGDFRRAGGVYTRGFSIWNGVVSAGETSDLTLLTPVANDTLEFGTCFEFTWDTTTTAEELTIEISMDSGATWSVIHNKADAKLGRLPWVVPDTNAAYCKVRIANGDSPCETIEPMFTFAITSDSTIESWWLTHAGGTYYKEPFLPGYTSFNFSNTKSNQWPDSLWKSIDYSDFDDPPDTIENFPDWFLYAEAYGDDWSFRNGNHDRPKSKAVKHWQSILTEWGGSCLGFSTASLLWLLGNDFNTDLIVPYEPLYYLDYNTFTRNAANKHWIYQMGEKHQEQDVEASKTLTPIETLELIKEKFTADYPRTLSFSWRSWEDKLDDDSVVVDSSWDRKGHNVVPYHIINVPDSLGIYYMYYYDPNSPADLNRWARIDSVNNVWRMSHYQTRDTTSRIIPRLPIIEYYGLANDDRTTSGLKDANSSTYAQVFTSANEEILMTDSLGNQIGWMNNEEILTGLTGGAIFPDDPEYKYSYPNTYLVPHGSYRIELSNFENDETKLSWFTDSTTYFYHRDSTLNDQNDILIVGDDAVSIVRNSGLVEKVSVGMIKTTDSTEKLVQLSGMTFSPIDSMEMKIDSTGAILLSNTGINRAFSLLLWNSEDGMAEDEIRQSYYYILINGGTNQKIIPPWGTLETQPVLLLTDEDQNGVFEDTSVIAVTTDVEDEIGSTLPDTYMLTQNYPNPFNPSTTIEYSLPVRSDVIIEILNVLGQRVKRLVDEEQAAGNYQVIWDSRNESGQRVATGIYFYRLTADGFTKTKKMLLLR